MCQPGMRDSNRQFKLIVVQMASGPDATPFCQQDLRPAQFKPGMLHMRNKFDISGGLLCPSPIIRSLHTVSTESSHPSKFTHSKSFLFNVGYMLHVTKKKHNL